MGWHWTALLIGLLAPWLLTRRALLVTFYRGPVVGMTCWLLVASLTTPVVFAAFWLVTKLAQQE